MTRFRVSRGIGEPVEMAVFLRSPTPPFPKRFLLSRPIMPSSFTDTLARRLDRSPEAAEEALRTLAEEVRAEAARGDQFALDGLGVFSQGARTLSFAPEAPLADLVNRHYAGLEPLPLASVPEQAPPVAAEEPPEEPTPTEPRPPVESVEPADEDAIGSMPAWQPAEEPDDHPLGPLPEPPFEKADYAVMDDEEEAPKAPSRRAALPPEALRTPLAPVQDGLFAANLRLQAEALKGASIVSSASQAPQQAPDRAPEEREPRRRTYATSALSWIGGLLALLLLAGGSWYFFGGRGAVPPFPLASGPPAADADPPRAVSSMPTPAPADSAAAAGPTPGDTAATAPISDETSVENTSRAPVSDSLGFDAAAGEWVLVVASRTDRANAERALEQFRGRFAGTDLAAELLVGETDGVRRYRVALGPFPSLDATNAASERYGERLPPGAWPHRLPE